MPRVQRARQLCLERAARPGLRGGNEREGGDSDCRRGETKRHGLSIFQARRQTSRAMGRPTPEDGPGGPFRLAPNNRIIGGHAAAGRDRGSTQDARGRGGRPKPRCHRVDAHGRLRRGARARGRALADSNAAWGRSHATPARCRRTASPPSSPSSPNVSTRPTKRSLDSARSSRAFRASGGGAAPQRPRARARRSRCGPRRPRPGCGCRSGAS